jgi:large subunit ribosomal protein L6
MSRVGKQPISIPAGVTVTLSDQRITVKGPLGELTQEIVSGISVHIDNATMAITRCDDTRRVRAFHGLVRSLIYNMVVGVSQGYSRVLEMVGVGYRAQVNGKNLVLTVGFSHPVTIVAPTDVTFAIENNTVITVKGIDKQVVGQVAADIRSIRKPEPYKGKGIHYQGEKITRKAGKTAASASS